MESFASSCARSEHFVSDRSRKLQADSVCVKKSRTWFGQGGVLLNKTASASRDVFDVHRFLRLLNVLNAFGLFARAK
jgi:hypothetical protein